MNKNENLAALSSSFLEIVILTLYKYGGDLIQFFGHSLIAIWPNSTNFLDSNVENNEINEAEFASEVTRKATQCALEIRREILKQLGKNVQVMFGISFGNF